MTSSLFLSVTTFAYLGCALGYLGGLTFRARALFRAGALAGLLALLLQTAGLLLRWKESYDLGIGHAPLSNLYESLVFGAWAVMVVYLALEWRTGQKALGVIPALIAFIVMAYASFSTDARIQPLVPALKSNWLIAHVVTCFIGYAAFAVSFGMSVVYLARSGKPEAPGGFLPDQRRLDDLNYRMVLFGFLWLTVGIVTGSVWAHSAWGTWWGWDPKETWSLITWLVYAALLHARLTRGWRGKTVAWLSVLGFGCVIFTYLGVNFLLSGLHSYGAN